MQGKRKKSGTNETYSNYSLGVGLIIGLTLAGLTVEAKFGLALAGPLGLICGLALAEPA